MLNDNVKKSLMDAGVQQGRVRLIQITEKSFLTYSSSPSSKDRKCELVALTTSGLSQEKLTIPEQTTSIGASAFEGCSENLKEITIKSTKVTFDPQAFTSLSNKVLFTVRSKSAKDHLISLGIDAKRITLSNTSLSTAQIIGIVIGVVALTIITLGLGIGLRMRKQHKIK